MRKSIIAFVPGFVLALAAVAAAQDRPITTNKDNKDTLHASVSGTVNLDYVWRSQEMTGFTDSILATSTPANSHAENTFEGYLAVRLDVDLNDKVSAVVEFGTKRVDGGEINNWGNNTANLIQLREARVTVADFLTQGLKLGVGISDWSFDVRGKGNSFAFDPRHAQSFGHNMTTTGDGPATLGARAGFPEELEPVGFWLNWTSNQITLDLVALPAVVEGGPLTADEAIYAVDFWYALDAVGKGSKVGAILAIDHAPAIAQPGIAPVPGSHADIFTLGGGADVKMMDGNLELFGEAYIQFGKATNVPDAAAGIQNSAHAKGYAFNFGGQYTIPNNPIWLGASFNYLSGDKDAGPNKNINSFLSYENINDLMILEDMYLGFDWDTNYWAFKLNGGFAMSLGAGKDNLKIDAILGITKTAQTVTFATTSTKNLGDEFDINVRWILTKQASLHLGLGFLFSSDVLKDSMQTFAASDAKNHAIEYVLGADLKF